MKDKINFYVNFRLKMAYEWNSRLTKAKWWKW